MKEKEKEKEMDQASQIYMGLECGRRRGAFFFLLGLGGKSKWAGQSRAGFQYHGPHTV